MDKNYSGRRISLRLKSNEKKSHTPKIGKTISKSRNKSRVTTSKISSGVKNYSLEKKKISLLNKKNERTFRIKTTKQKNIITESIPDKNSTNWKLFTNNFQKYKYIYEKTHKTNFEVELYRISQLVNVPVGFLRSLTKDFMSNFRNDSHELVKSNIHEACQNNFEKNQLCYCCGEKIKAKDSVSCDHLIPIMCMLLIVDTESVNDNLFYIHKKCNGIKSDMDIFNFYNLAGTPIFNNTNNKIKCRKLIDSHLKKIKFRSYENILERFDRISKIEKHLENIYEEVKLLTTTGQQALVIDAFTMLGEQPLYAIPEDMEITKGEGKKTKKIKSKKHATQKNRKKKKIKKRKK